MKLTFTKPKRGPGSSYRSDGTYAKNMPVVTTVGELRDLLAHLPDDLPVNSMDDGFKPVRFNVGKADEHLSLEDNDGTFDD